MNTDKIHTLMRQIRRQFDPGIHTMSVCEKCGIVGCRHLSLGICGDCATDQLGDELNDHILATEYLDAVVDMAQVTGAILEKIE
jgi:hypothetical protein